ncbi:MAG: CoA-binding protein [Acidobacteria bacterium]|nr:CoA-binding protein [Acidobacteriota bacterium]
MVTRQEIDDFVAGRTMALVGISADGKGFGNAAYKELKKRGYRVLPVHPRAGQVQGDACWPSLSALPERVERLLVMVEPGQVPGVIQEAAACGVKQVWLQQGAESPAGLEACRQAGMQVIDRQCILMFAEPVGSLHGFHRWVWQLIGKAPRKSPGT